VTTPPKLLASDVFDRQRDVRVMDYGGRRKRKKCDECDGPIEDGKPYFYKCYGYRYLCWPCGCVVQAEAKEAEAAERRSHRDERRLAILRGEILS
jgi:hypothetical protein